MWKKQDRSPAGADPALVNPVAGKNSPAAGPLAVMVSSEADLRYLADAMPREARDCRNFLMSRYYWQSDSKRGGLLIGPVIGAPYAAMLLENLIAWGTRQLIFFGWGGAVAEDVRIGDIILPTGAMSDEGTSRHYGYPAGEVIQAVACADPQDWQRPWLGRPERAPGAGLDHRRHLSGDRRQGGPVPPGRRTGR